MNIINGIKINSNHIYINNKIIIITTIKIINISKKTHKSNIILNTLKIKYKPQNKTPKPIIKSIKTISTISKGKGFCGTIKKHKFSSNRASHGNSKAHNKPGSIGMCQTPGRLLKGKKMAGRMGNKKIKIYNKKIIFFKKNIIIVKGPIPGNKKRLIKLTL